MLWNQLEDRKGNNKALLENTAKIIPREKQQNTTVWIFYDLFSFTSASKLDHWLNCCSWQTFAPKVPPSGLSNLVHPSQLRLSQCDANMCWTPPRTPSGGDATAHEHMNSSTEKKTGTDAWDRSSFETSTFPLCLHVGDVVRASCFISSVFSSLGTLLGLALQAQMHFEMPSPSCKCGHISHSLPALVYVKGMEQGRGQRYVTGR